MLKIKLLALLITIIAIGGFVYNHHQDAQAAKIRAKAAQEARAKELANRCRTNKLAKSVLVSVGQRRMWACEAGKTVYDNPVITGMEMYPADLTPRGTYQIYTKQTDQTLTGCDSTGCWKDPVSYWLPFLSNKYGIYGFHDATWRAATDFGGVNPNSKDASHGCVEMPLVASKWLYNWADVGTTVTVTS